MKPDLDGKLHVVVGTADTYHLDGAVHLLQTTLDGLGAKSDFRYFVGRGHGDLTIEGIDAFGLDKAIAWEMYAVARPGIKRPPYAPVRDSVIDLGQGAPPVVIQTR